MTQQLWDFLLKKQRGIILLNKWIDDDDDDNNNKNNKNNISRFDQTFEHT